MMGKQTKGGEFEEHGLEKGVGFDCGLDDRKSSAFQRCLLNCWWWVEVTVSLLFTPLLRSKPSFGLDCFFDGD